MADETFAQAKSKRLTSDWSNVLIQEETSILNKKWVKQPIKVDTSAFFGLMGEVLSIKKVDYPTGSTYEGQWSPVDMEGYGIYTMPHGVVYEGEMKDGMFHGNGSLIYPQGQMLTGIFHKGKLMTWTYSFAKNPDVNLDSYCKYPDRRYCHSMIHGFKGAPNENLTEEQPTRIIPENCYDVIDGFYNPKTKWVQSTNDSEKYIYCPLYKKCPSANAISTKAFIERIPCVPIYKTADWIEGNCKRASDEHVGYKPEFYERWCNGAKGEKLKSRFKIPPKTSTAQNLNPEALFHPTRKDSTCSKILKLFKNTFGDD